MYTVYPEYQCYRTVEILTSPVKKYLHLYKPINIFIKPNVRKITLKEKNMHLEIFIRCILAKFHKKVYFNNEGIFTVVDNTSSGVPLDGDEIFH